MLALSAEHPPPLRAIGAPALTRKAQHPVLDRHIDAAPVGAGYVSKQQQRIFELNDVYRRSERAIVGSLALTALESIVHHAGDVLLKPGEVPKRFISQNWHGRVLPDASRRGVQVGGN